jgi:hypothetical protein
LRAGVLGRLPAAQSIFRSCQYATALTVSLMGTQVMETGSLSTLWGMC